MKERQRIEKRRGFGLLRPRETPTVLPWFAACETCDFRAEVRGGIAAGDAADAHVRANRTHRVQLETETPDGKRQKVISVSWRPSMAFENDDIRR